MEKMENYEKNGKKMNNHIYNIIKKFNLYKLNNKFIRLNI